VKAKETNEENDLQCNKIVYGIYNLLRLCPDNRNRRDWFLDILQRFLIVKCQIDYLFILHVSVTQQPQIDTCVVKLHARPTPSSAERVVAEAACAAEGLDPEPVWVGDDLDFSRLSSITVNWRAEYTNRLSLPQRPTSTFFIKTTPANIGITGGNYTVSVGS